LTKSLDFVKRECIVLFMAQRPKPRVKEAIVKAASDVFAEAGFEGAVLSDIVERAGTSIGNFYKYFASKEALFADFLPEGFPAEVEQRVQAQVRALGAATNVFALPAEHPYWRAVSELLSVTITHRQRVVFLLLRARGTKHERFAEELAKLLVALALEHARGAYPGFAGTAAQERALTRIYRGFIAGLGAILVEERSEKAVRAAIATLSVYHLSGLKALFSAPSEPAGASPR
jgi:AcrR family transcriptional regulator